VKVSIPLLEHPHEAPSVLRPEDLMEAVRTERSMALVPVSSICVLDFDGEMQGASLFIPGAAARSSRERRPSVPQPNTVIDDSLGTHSFV